MLSNMSSTEAAPMTCHTHSTHSVLSPSLRHWRLTWFKFKLLPSNYRGLVAPRSLPTLLLVCCVPPSRKCVSFSCFVRYHLGNKQSYVFDVRRSLVIFPTTYLRSDTLLPLLCFPPYQQMMKRPLAGSNHTRTYICVSQPAGLFVGVLV